MFRALPGVSGDVHMHGVDDVKEVLHDGHALQRRVGPGYAIYTLNERAGAYTRFNLDYVR